MLLGLKILSMICLLIGTIICFKGMKSKNALYKGGFFFFLLTFIENTYSLIIQRLANSIIQSLIEKGNNNISYWIMSLNIPSLLLNIIALIIFIIFLLKGLSTNSKKDNMNISDI